MEGTEETKQIVQRELTALIERLETAGIRLNTLIKERKIVRGLDLVALSNYTFGVEKLIEEIRRR